MAIVQTLCLGDLQTNCYVVYDEHSNEAIVVDPADSFEIINDFICSKQLKVKYIIITHAHYDHIGALDELKNCTGAKICIGEYDAESLSDGYMNLADFFNSSSPAFGADILLKDDDIIHISEVDFRVIHTPGHTKGGICIFFNGSLISGDTLFRESVGRTDFPGGDFSALIKSIKEKLFILDDKVCVFPGHGMQTSIGHEKNNNAFVR